MSIQPELTPELILEAYRQGLFPMAYSADSKQVHWVRPEMRGQLSIPNLHIPGKLGKTLLAGKIRGFPYEVRINTAFAEVITACARLSEKRAETWINQGIIESYCALHALGRAHSVECWREGKLIGGLYGLALGGAFFGESMFSRESNASKIALVHLAARLWQGGFTVLDTQFVNPHLLQFGVYEVPDKEYMKQLKMALSQQADFLLAGVEERSLIRAYLKAHSCDRKAKLRSLQ
ncbi:MAG: leucyl/phenylalanyl-tRNA--protein transferase [Alphaproteobacteria bacterium]|nr:leucyl/phenylalanyl-tRNA--protein transferase [Alphaproteobacteria bacterium]